MSRFLKYLANNRKNIYLSLLFIVAAGIVVVLFPLQGKFKYEYQKGTPWQHDNLIAPFDFAILKSDFVLTQERDSVMRKFKPYFVKNESVKSVQMAEYAKTFDSRFAEAKKVTHSIFPKVVLDDSLKLFTKSIGKEILEFIYNKGVADFSEVLEQTFQGNTIVVVNNKVAENRDVEEIFTQKKAYSYIGKALGKKYPNDTWVVNLIENLKLYDFVEQNLVYDEAKSQKAQQAMISNLSTTIGMVQGGERIVARGDLIHDENFQVLESLKKEYESILGSGGNAQWIFIGQILLIIICFGVLYLFLLNFRVEVLDDFSKSLFIILMVLLMVISASLVVRFNSISIYLIPFAALPIIIQTFYDSRLAFFIHMVTIMLCGFLAPNGFEFIILQFVSGAVAIFSMAHVYKRGSLFLSVGLIIFSYSLTYTALALMQEGDLTKIKIDNFIWFALGGGLLLVAYPLIFIFEKTFGFLSEVTLLELSDTNHPALRELAEKAPGTFQHVMQVANLADEVVRKIGGNTLLLRVGALYHDIGKAGAPGYFVENQSGKNPHDKLPYDKSAEVIIQHVYHGVELAKKHKLPQPIIDFIVTHHGTGMVKYFYTKFANENEGVVPDISKFSYPGPTPYTKETAVLLMADAVEASSRTLREYNEKSIDELVERIINTQIDDNQFIDCDITFRDISTAKEIFKAKLLNIYHARIEYPELKKK